MIVVSGLLEETSDDRIVLSISLLLFLRKTNGFPFFLGNDICFIVFGGGTMENGHGFIERRPRKSHRWISAIK